LSKRSSRAGTGGDRWSPWRACRASAARMRRDAVVSRRPASASASPRVPRRRSPPSQLSSSASPPSNFGPPALRSEITLRTKSIKGRFDGGQGLAALPVAIQGRGAKSGRERQSESWLGAQTPTRPHGEADADAGRRGTTAPRRTRAADASQAASATSVFAPVPDRARAERARDNPRGSAADSRKRAKRPAQGARTAKRQGVTAISRLPNPRDARRNAHHAPSRRAPGIGRTCTTHDTRRRPEAGHPPIAGATRQTTPDFHFPKNENRNFALYLQGHTHFHARKMGEPPKRRSSRGRWVNAPESAQG